MPTMCRVCLCMGLIGKKNETSGGGGSWYMKECAKTISTTKPGAVLVLNPWDSQGNQIADGDGIYPTIRECGGFLNRNSSEARTIGFEWEMSPTLRESVIPSVLVLNPWDSQGNQIADGDGIYPTIRGCGGAGYQAGYVFDRKSDGSE